MPPKPKPAPAAPTIEPAPHNGAPYGERRSPRRAEGQRQLSQRIPAELYERLAACSEDTGVTQRRLLLDALAAELERRGF